MRSPAEAFDDPPDGVLFPEEAAISRAVEKRRRDFRTVRHCSRRALRELGVPPTAVAPGERRKPVWPPGVVGSLTHCTGYRAAAVAHIRVVYSPSSGSR
jgi:4'-phosphopantetheinyl transferase EntD